MAGQGIYTQSEPNGVFHGGYENKDSLPAAFQQHTVARLDAEPSNLDGCIGPRLEDDTKHTQRNSHTPKHKPIIKLPVHLQLINGVLELDQVTHSLNSVPELGPAKLEPGLEGGRNACVGLGSLLTVDFVGSLNGTLGVLKSRCNALEGLPEDVRFLVKRMMCLETSNFTLVFVRLLWSSIPFQVGSDTLRGSAANACILVWRMIFPDMLEGRASDMCSLILSLDIHSKGQQRHAREAQG